MFKIKTSETINTFLSSLILISIILVLIYNLPFTLSILILNVIFIFLSLYRQIESLSSDLLKKWQKNLIFLISLLTFLISFVYPLFLIEAFETMHPRLPLDFLIYFYVFILVINSLPFLLISIYTNSYSEYNRILFACTAIIMIIFSLILHLQYQTYLSIVE